MGQGRGPNCLEAKLQNHLEVFFKSEDLINFDAQQHRKLATVFPSGAPTNAEEARAHREEVLPPEIEEIYGPRPEVTLEDEDDDHKANQPLSEREIRELLKLHRNLGHPQPAELARGLRSAGARKEAIRFVMKDLRCPTCESRPRP